MGNYRSNFEFQVISLHSILCEYPWKLHEPISIALVGNQCRRKKTLNSAWRPNRLWDLWLWSMIIKLSSKFGYFIAILFTDMQISLLELIYDVDTPSWAYISNCHIFSTWYRKEWLTYSIISFNFYLPCL